MIAELAHELLPYAVVLYAADGLVRVRQGERALCAAWGGRFRWRGPGWHVGGLLPTAEVFVVGAPSPRATAPVSASVSAAAPRSAADIRRSAERDVAAVRTLRAVQSRYSTRLAVAGALLFATTFGALPMAVYRYHDVPFAVTATVAAAALLWAAILIVAARALRSGGATRNAIASALAPALFFPPAAGHVLGFLWRDAFRASPPLAVAAVLLAPAHFRRLARQELRRIEEAERHDAGTPSGAGAQAARADLLGLLAALGIAHREVAAEDPPRDAQAAVFCPLCEAEYRSGFVACTDCDVPLKAFSTRPGTGERKEVTEG